MKNIPFITILLMAFLLSCSHKKEAVPPGAKTDDAPDLVQSGMPAGRPGGTGGPGGIPGNNMTGTYAVLTLVPQSVTIHQNFPSVIEGQRVIEIRPMISGYIQDIHVDEGDQVRKGQLLFTINNPQYLQAVISSRAQVSSALANVNTARMEVEKVKPLVEKEIVSSYRLQNAELTLRSREADYEVAQAALANAEANLGYTVIKSPENGIIGTIPYKNGALVSSNSAEALTTLSDIHKVFAYFSWNEKQVLDMLNDLKGLSIEEKINGLPPATLILANGAEYKYKGKIEMASGLISTKTGSGTFKAIFQNPEAILRSGLSATIKIPQNYDSVLVVPQSATYELQDKRFIYVVENGNRVRSANISTIATDDGKFFIVTTGLNTGDKIVTEGIVSLSDGITITPRETSPESVYQGLF